MTQTIKFITLAALALGPAVRAETPEPPKAVAAALEKAGDNKSRLLAAREGVPASSLAGMDFLLANMPERDLRTLTPEFLIENVNLAYEARKAVPWGKDIPEELFLNHVLPYANVDEQRDPWRKEFFDLCLPVVKDCETPGEAAAKLNSFVFKHLKVKYSTRRLKPHQSPKESIDQGMASCTGLSIMLSDACRSVCVPARLAGVASWAEVPGNHTWVEVWDQGWHFTGACEPDPKGLDRGWFAGRAAKAQKDSRAKAVWAASFRRTGETFPLVWSPKSDVPAENVTDRYTKTAAATSEGELGNEPRARLKEAAIDYFTGKGKPDRNADVWLKAHPDEVKRIAWEAYKEAPIHADTKKDFDANRVTFETHESAYTVKTVGERPEGGWPLFIAMHGGGNAPKRLNDSQWKIMQRYYRDQDSVKGYKYLALRAPNDTWNGFYAPYVLPLIENLVRQFVLFGDVDSDKVYLMGYSHGGYGAFYLGPKLPYRFAAVHASAAAPTDGTISPRTLLNTRFTFMIGEKDTAYGRRERCERFAKQIADLEKETDRKYPVEMEFKKGFGHGGLPDRDKIKDMYSATRNATPKNLIWDLTDEVVDDFYWLSVPKPAAKQSVEASIKGNEIAVKTESVAELSVWLDGRLIDVKKPVVVTHNGDRREFEATYSFADLCRSIQERGDPKLAFPIRLSLKAAGE